MVYERDTTEIYISTPMQKPSKVREGKGHKIIRTFPSELDAQAAFPKLFLSRPPPPMRTGAPPYFLRGTVM